MRAPVILASMLAAVIVGSCGGGTTPTTGAPSAPGTTAAPTLAGTSPAATSGSSGTTVANAAQGVELTLPAGWIAVTPEIAADSAAVADLKAAAGANAKTVDDLIASLSQNPGWWMAASNPSNQNIITGSVLTNTGDLAAWTVAQEAALKGTYGTVEKKAITTPKPGTAFTFTNGQFATRLYGFERPGGIALFTFAAPASTGAPADWDDIISTFEDAGP